MNAQVQDLVPDVTSEIQNVFAEITRYPLEILDLEANLETDLGIDSVKLGEVFSVLREKYNLPAKMDIPRESLMTIAGISLALRQYLSGTLSSVPGIVDEVQAAPRPTVVAEAAGVVGFPISDTDAPGVDATTNGVRNVFAKVTGYPLEILDVRADFEADLGIDSTKLEEVFSALREQFSLPEEPDIFDPQFKDIAGISQALHRHLLRATTGLPPPVGEKTSVELESGAAPTQFTSGTDRVSKSFAGLKPEHKPFAGKVALVTGSGRGLGKEIVTYLADLGASVIVNSFHSRNEGVRTVEEIKAKGGDAVHFWGSVANPDHVNNLFDQIEQTHGALDFLVSNASNGMLARLENITVEHWEKAFRTNVVGLHQCATRAVKLMRKRGGGKIITLSSPASHGYVDYFGCMGAVKAAVESLTRSMAIEFSPDNIQVNCISPGPIYGDLLDKWPESKRLIAQWEGNTAYKRLCESRDVSHFVAYLLSEQVNLFNGSVLVMDGGISISGF